MGALMADWHVGQKVVCIRTFSRNHYPETHPQKGKTYTIRGFHPDRDSIVVEEIVNPHRRDHTGFGEVHYCLTRFRPIVKTDISIFEAMLAPSPKQRVDADA